MPRTPLSRLVLVLVAVAASLGSAGLPARAAGAATPASRERHAAYERAVVEAVAAERLRALHDLLGSEPHLAGTPGDHRVIERIAAAFESHGLEVEKQELWLYLSRPVDAALEIVEPVAMSLPVKEETLEEDHFTKHADTRIGWNAYSGSGDVTAPVVYANYGTKEDFERLRELGVDCAGTVVIARYGGNFRGYKAKYAEEAGAAALVIYTDPADSGFAQGLAYPEGGYANASAIQRGSIATLAWTGDPLTPFEPATKDAARLDPDEVGLPKIPVQPVGWAAAQEILSRMKGPAVPPADGERAPGRPARNWQGGLPFTYRLTGGDDLRVRIMVKQERSLVKTFNVVGTLRGERFPGQLVIMGCHHDAWEFGAHDPLSGMILVLEAARVFGEAAKRGERPARSILFAAWGAEEFGIIGSSEWVEANRDRLSEGAVAYINTDAATFGMQFGASAAPSLKALIADAAAEVYQAPAGEPGEIVEAGADAGVARAPRPRMGDLGGGSDHVGFYCHVGVPSAGLNSSGGRGTAYHSIYDNLVWYRHVLGDDYEPALLLCRAASLALARLANSDLLPLDPAQYGPDFRGHLERIEQRAAALGVEVDFTALEALAESHEKRARDVHDRLLAAVESGALSGDALDRVNAALLRMERAWVHEPGLPDRPWFRGMYAAPDETAGYAAWMLPMLRWAVEHRDEEGLERAVKLYGEVFGRLEEVLQEVEAAIAAE